MNYNDIFKFSTDNIKIASIESLEQKNIINEHSLEADDDDDNSFEASTTDEADNNVDKDTDSEKSDTVKTETEKSDTSETPDEDLTEEPSDEDDGFPEDPIDEDGEVSDSEQSDGESEQEDGSDSDDSSSDENKKGSSVNPFTDVNQRLYLLDQMNLLYSSIAKAVDKFNISYAETVELQQLKELLEIVEEEQKSFIMQQNPENMIKYELYIKRFEEIIRNLTSKIKET